MDTALLAEMIGYSFLYGEKQIPGNGSMAVDNRLSVTVEKTEYPEFDAIEWVLWFENPSKERSEVLSDIRDIDRLAPLPEFSTLSRNIALPGDRAVITMRGTTEGPNYGDSDWKSAGEFAAVPHYFKWPHRQSFSVESKGGRPSNGECPFFEITQGGQGEIVALGWTGDWTASFSNEEGGVRVRAGLRNARFYLKPGEKVRTSRVLVMKYSQGEDGPNKFRRLVRKHFSHTATRPGTREGIFAYELWGGLTSAEMSRRLKTLKSRGLAYEDYWIDAGWYGDCKDCDDAYVGDWASFTGDWHMNPRVHADGMADVKEAANEAGGSLMLWFEPERVRDTTRFFREHRDWLLEDGGGDCILNLGLFEARDYVVELLDGYVKRLGLSCYRQDFNTSPERFFAAADEEDRRGITEIRHVLGLYEVWDELLRRNPGLVIDNCSSGGRRIDIETLRRSVAFFRSDYQCAFNANADVLQAHNAGISRLLPYTGCTTKLSDAYSLRSAYSSSHGVAYWNAVFQEESKVDWEAAKKCRDEYLRIRRFFPCDFHNLGSAVLDLAAWAVWQYHDPESGEGVVLAFRRSESPCDRARFRLKGLPPNVKVSTENLDSGEKGVCDGELEVVLPQKRSSTVILYRAGK